MGVSVCRRAHFNAAHRLHNSEWSDEKNREVFGKCNNPNYHGHNYEIEVWVTGDVSPETGFVIELGYLQSIIKEEVEDNFDHKNLNLDTQEFKSLNPSVENIAIVIWNKLRNRLDTKFGLKIRLYETARNFVEYTG